MLTRVTREAMAPKLVDSPTVRQASLHVSLPTYAYLYAVPYSLLYAVLLSLYVVFEYDGETVLIATAAVVLGHALLFLSTQWSMAARALITCRKVTDPWKAELICIYPAEHQGKPDMSRLQIETAEDGSDQLWFSFQRRKFIFNSDKKVHFCLFSFFFSPFSALCPRCVPRPRADPPLPLLLWPLWRCGRRGRRCALGPQHARHPDAHL